MNGKVLLVGGDADGRWVDGNRFRTIPVLKKCKIPVTQFKGETVPVIEERNEVEFYRPVRFTGSVPGVEIVVFAVEGMNATEVLLKLVEGYRRKPEALTSGGSLCLGEDGRAQLNG